MRRYPLAALLTACAPAPADDDDAPPPDPWADGCDLDAPEFRDIDVGAVTLHVACRGAGPTLVLLHGFPEFWFGWDRVMDELAADFRLIAPDQRGYDLSEKPWDVQDYLLQPLVDDVHGLIDAVGGGPVTIVGHDWGGGVAWAVGSDPRGNVERLAILNAPHMNVFLDLLATDPAQRDAFSYLDLFVLEGAEDVLAANDFAALANTMGDALTDDELVAYKEAWGQPGALTGGLNWYRANFPDGMDPLPKAPGELVVDLPTLVLWGMRDDALLPQNLDGLPTWVGDLTIEEFPDATHWIAHEEPGEVAQSLRAFVGG
jgi:pimeloyl-ACP methyl ester carboxylesterase